MGFVDVRRSRKKISLEQQIVASLDLSEQCPFTTCNTGPEQIFAINSKLCFISVLNVCMSLVIKVAFYSNATSITVIYADVIHHL